MIKNDEIIQQYKTNNNKIYIPTQYNSQDYKYTISGDEITIITNVNCTTNYNTTYCDCYRYNERYNIITESYQCNRNPSNYMIDYTNISSDINDSYRITRDYTNNYIIMIGIVIIAILLATMFKRNSIKI